MIGGKYYGWTPPKKTTTTSSPTFGSIVSNFVNSYKPPKKETKHPLTGASGTTSTKTTSTPASTNVPSFWDALTNLPSAAKKPSKNAWEDAAARGAGIAAAAGTAGTDKPRSERPSSTPIVDPDVRRAQLAAGYGTPGMPELDAINTDPVRVAALQTLTNEAEEEDYSDPYGRPTEGPGFGRGVEGLETEDYVEDTSNAPDPTMGGGGGGGNGGGGPADSQTEEDVFQGPTEAELALARAKRLWSNRLKTAAAAAESARKRLLLESNAANEKNLRDTYGQFRDHRRSLSGSGTGFSPRFTLAVKQALDQQSRARAADIRRSHVNQMMDIIGNLRDVRDTASENLSDEELNLLLTSSGDNLANVTGENVASWFNTKKSGASN